MNSNQQYRIPEHLKPRLKKLKAFLLDVDGVLTDSAIHQTENGFETKVITMMDKKSIRAAQRLGCRFGIITAGNSEIIRQRAKELNIHDLYEGSLDKNNAYEEFKQLYGLQDEEIAYMGDEVFDVSLLKKVGFAVAPANGHSAAKLAAHYVTQNIGGHGAVREVLTLLLHVRQEPSAL